ncbi:MAG TPA: SDR family oxidoreductase [Candidatus Dormibacteraeota bacterium]|nr:SDR family oxidoreductase [Candidatus Dormibacteraeota bacterium]
MFERLPTRGGRRPRPGPGVGPAGQPSAAAQRTLAPLLTPQGRLVAPAEVASVCVLLASDAGRGINGAAVNVDGGQVQV